MLLFAASAVLEAVHPGAAAAGGRLDPGVVFGGEVAAGVAGVYIDG
jgi:hypothetical protein